MPAAGAPSSETGHQIKRRPSATHRPRAVSTGSTVRHCFPARSAGAEERSLSPSAVVSAAVASYDARASSRWSVAALATSAKVRPQHRHRWRRRGSFLASSATDWSLSAVERAQNGQAVDGAAGACAVALELAHRQQQAFHPNCCGKIPSASNTRSARRVSKENCRDRMGVSLLVVPPREPT